MKDKKMVKIALFGGSFDPPHVVHQMISLYIQEVGDVDGVWMVPCQDHPLGKPLTPFFHRAAMCRLATQGIEGVMVSTVEESLPAPSRTLQTIRYLRQTYENMTFTLVVGADILEETDKWYGWEEIEKLVKIFLVGRSGWSGATNQNTVAFPEVSSSEIRSLIRKGEPVDHLVSSVVLDYIRANELYT